MFPQIIEFGEGFCHAGNVIDVQRGIRTKGSQTFDNCLRAADCVYSANDISLEADEKTSADIFVDPDNHDFTLKITKLIGDPRWYPED